MWNEEKRIALLTEPSAALLHDITKIDGDIMVLGAGGKMGVTLSILARKSADKAAPEKRIIAVSRFSDISAKIQLKNAGVETISCDLLNPDDLKKLPDIKNIIFMAGRKFGTSDSEWLTWGHNSVLPALVCERFKGVNITVFSSGNVYPLTSADSAGCSETDKAGPIGEYAMSCLARERTFEYASMAHKTNVFIFRLSFAVDLTYGVICDIAANVIGGDPISLEIPKFNCIWQGSANEYAIRSLLHASSPAEFVNISGAEIYSVRRTAEFFGEFFEKTPVFDGKEGKNAYIADTSKMCKLFGKPTVDFGTLLHWQAEWLMEEGRVLNKPTHFEETGGKY